MTNEAVALLQLLENDGHCNEMNRTGWSNYT